MKRRQVPQEDIDMTREAFSDPRRVAELRKSAQNDPAWREAQKHIILMHALGLYETEIEAETMLGKVHIKVTIEDVNE